MRLAGFGGYDTIALTLARAGARLSSRTVARILREKPPRTPTEDSRHAPEHDALRARFPNHIFLVDLSDVPSLFGLFHFKLALILDAFSRFPVAARVFPKEPTAEDLVELLRRAVHRHGAPLHLVSDQGRQLIAEAFRTELENLGIVRRFGAVGETGSIALIERTWRSLKGLMAVRVFPPLVQSELERRFELALRYYAFHRPHQSLSGSTPAELYFGLEQSGPVELPLPRGRPGEGLRHPLFQIEFLDPERRFPVLVKAA